MRYDSDEMERQAILAAAARMCAAARTAPKAKGATRIYTPGEIEWTKHHVVDEEGFTIPADVEASLQQLAELSGIALPVEA